LTYIKYNYQNLLVHVWYTIACGQPPWFGRCVLCYLATKRDLLGNTRKVLAHLARQGGTCSKIHNGLVSAAIFSPSSSLSCHLNFCNNPLKIQEQTFILLILQIWSIFFIMIFLSWIIYKIGMPFQFHPS